MVIKDISFWFSIFGIFLSGMFYQFVYWYITACCQKVSIIYKNRNEKKKTFLRGTYDKFPDFFRVGTFIDSTHMKLKSPSK